jgi:hypothetical protein
MNAPATLALAIAAAFGCSGAAAQYVWQAQEAANNAAPARATVPAAASQGSGAGLRIFIDPATGKIRPAEQEELQSLAAQQAAILQTRPPLETFTTAAGVPGVRLDPSFDSYMVAIRRADGSLDVDCVPGAKQAAEALSAGAKPAGMIQKKAVLDEK